jgi:hypothetical protein
MYRTHGFVVSNSIQRSSAQNSSSLKRAGVFPLYALFYNCSSCDRRFQNQQSAAKYAAVEANMAMAILDGVLVDSGLSVTVENLEELLMPGNPHNVLDKLVITSEARQAQVEARMAARQLRKTPIEPVRAVVKTDARAQKKTIFSTEPPEVELVNPQTSQPFASRKELVNFLNGLSRTETRAFFFFPAGRQKAGVSEAVSKMLNGGVK